MSLTADIELERALIAEALRRYERFIARGLSLADFTDPMHHAVLNAAAKLWELGEPVSVGSVALELQRRGVIAKDGVERAVAALAVGNGLMPDHEKLRNMTRLRAVVECAHLASTKALNGDLQGALSTLAEVDQLGTSSAVTRTANEVADRVASSFYDQKASEQRRVYLGLREFDRVLGKLPVGSMMILGADTNVGKSRMALAMLIAIAEANVTCGLVSVEDPEDVTGARLLSAYTTNISSREIQHGRFDVGERNAMEELAKATHEIKRIGTRLLLEDRTGETELDVCAAMSRMAARGAKLVVVDYIQEVAASKAQQDRRNEIRWIAKRLKAHAKRIGVALVLVSQIARPKGQDEFKAPSKHALKESGDLVNSAEVIVVLWRQNASDNADVQLKVVKSKWGGVGASWTMRSGSKNGALVEPKT